MNSLDMPGGLPLGKRDGIIAIKVRQYGIENDLGLHSFVELGIDPGRRADGITLPTTSPGDNWNVALGSSGDVPEPADYDGDGKADYAVWRDSTYSFYWKKSSDPNATIQGVTIGASGDRPAPADYDGDGKADPTVFRDSNTTWYVYQTSTSSTQTYSFGASGDVLVPNDYDGDGKVDIATWRDSNGNWYIRQSNNGSTRTEHWGTSGDIPVPAYYRR